MGIKGDCLQSSYFSYPHSRLLSKILIILFMFFSDYVGLFWTLLGFPWINEMIIILIHKLSQNGRTCFLTQPLLEGTEVGLPVLLVDLHLLDEFLLCLLAEVVVLLMCLVENLLHVLPLPSQLLQHQGLLGLQQGFGDGGVGSWWG